MGGYDISREGREGFPKWYLILRCVLTVSVVMLHFVVLGRLSL